MTETTTSAPTGWLLATLKLLNEMAGEGITMMDCDDPADLMREIAEHLGVGDSDNLWEAAVKEVLAMSETAIQQGDWVAARDTSGKVWGGIVEAITPAGMVRLDGLEFPPDSVRPRHRMAELEQAEHRDRFHALKTWPSFFDAVMDGSKTFEVRKNDRGYCPGDIILLQRFDPQTGTYTTDADGHPLTVAKRVSYMLTGPQFGIEAGYSVMGLQNV